MNILPQNKLVDEDEYMNNVRAITLEEDNAPSAEAQQQDTSLMTEEDTSATKKHPDSPIYNVLGDNLVADNVYNTTDMLKGILTTPLKIGNDIINTGVDAVNAGIRFFDKDYGDDKKEEAALQLPHNELPESIKPKTPLGNFAQSAASWYLGGKMIDTAVAAKMTVQAITQPGALLKAQEVGNAFSELGKLITSPSPYKGGAVAEYTKEAIKDFVLNAPEDDTLATYVKETGLLEHPFLDLMAVDDDDDMLIRRMKHSLEGFVIGTSLETTFESGRQVVKLFKKMNGTDVSEKALKVFFDEADADYHLSTGYALRHQLTEAGYNDGQITQSMNLLESYAAVNKKEGQTIRQYLAGLDLNFLQKEMDDGVHGAIELPGILSDNPINILLNIADPNVEQVQTINHELSHFFMWDTYRRAVKDGDKTALSQWRAISEALAITPDAKAITPQQMETFANGFETWLSTGKAPVPALNKAFQSFRKQSQALALDMMDSGAQLNPKLREAFGQLFITPDMDEGLKALYAKGNLINESIADLAGVYYKKEEGRKLRTGLINLDYVDAPENIKESMRRVIEGMEKIIPENIRNVHDWNQVQSESIDLFAKAVSDPDKAPDLIKEAFRNNPHKETVAYVASQYFLETTNQLKEIAKLASAASEKDLTQLADNYADRFYRLWYSQGMVAKTAQEEMTQAARMLNASKMVNSIGGLGEVNLANIPLGSPAGHSVEDFIRDVKRVGLLNDTDKVMKYIKHASDPMSAKAVGVLNEYFTNSLLSNPATSMVNLVGNAMVTGTTPLEYIIGGYISKGLSKAKGLLGLDSKSFAQAGDDAVRMGSRLYTGIGLSWKDARDTASAAWKNESSVWGMKNSTGLLEFGPDRWIASGTFGLDPESSIGRAVDVVGKIINLPSKALMSGDDFFKSINGRSMLYADLWEEGISKGITKQKDLVKFVKENWDDRIFRSIKDGVLQKEVLMDSKATEYALLQTFSNDRGTLVSALSNLKKSHPLLHPLIPFVRTPARLVDWTVQRTPLGLLYQQQRDALRAGGAEASKVLGQWALGGMFIGSAVMLAQSGRITGGGPNNPQVKKSMMDLGWQPYSLKVGDTWYSFNRLDPIGSFFGVVGDYLEIANATGDSEDDANTVMDCAQALLLAVAKNTTSKTYLQNIGSLINIIENPDIRGGNKVSSYASQVGQGFIPRIVTNLARDTGMTDPYMKEASSFLDRIKARTPGLSNDLPIQYSWLTGETRTFGDYSLLNFTPDRESIDDQIHQELISYGAKLGGPSRTMSSQRLTDEQYSRLCELHGTLRIGGKNLMEALESTVRTSAYQALPEGDERMKELNSVIGEYREIARDQLRREYKDELTPVDNSLTLGRSSGKVDTDLQKLIKFGNKI